jgi:uncharacterized protein YdhG (YjbR/CyaY superfamily)
MSAPTPFTAHFDSVTPAVRERLEALRAAIREEAPAAEECISYGIPTFDLHGKHLVHFAGYANHVGLYPGAKAMVQFEADFAAYKRAKGSVQFPNDQPLPVELVRRVVRFRLGEVAPAPRKKRA